MKQATVATVAGQPVSPISLEEDGFIPVTLKTPLGEFSFQVDLYEVHDRLVDLGKPPEGFLPGVVELLLSKGVAGVSHRMADRFANAIFATVNALKKADAGGSKLDSPASTESTPGVYHPASA